ncbi:bacterial Ig-like domain-containing protein [Lactococcus garvieae]|uniref:bacterial Ig-like domain-containing protein n=1 Tax=Lactococcus garvieae TaxID=1363 RepID=UPI00398E3DC3
MKQWKWIVALGLLLLTTIGLLSVPSQNVSAEVRGINADKSAPTGDPSISYPQISIRTNRTPERTPLDEIVQRADDAAAQFPIEEQEQRAQAVFKELTSYFGSGSLGHAWVIIFNSVQPGDYTSYGFHDKYGFVKNGTAGDQNDRPDRLFNVSLTVPLTNPEEVQSNLEENVIPDLIEQSNMVATAMGLPTNEVSGVYTPINNCSWFAGNVWNAIKDEQLVFEQEFDGSAHAYNWGMPFLNDVTEIGDPGMIAESISEKNTAKIILKDVTLHVGDKWNRKLPFVSCFDEHGNSIPWEDGRITSNNLNIDTSKPGVYNNIKYTFKGALGNVDSNPVTIKVVE